MLIFLKFLAAIALLVSIHILAIAAVGHRLGVSVRTVSLGFGPLLWSRGVFQLRALPLGGSVQFKDTRETGEPFDAPADYFDDAFNHQPRKAQILITLAGVAALAVVALVLRQGAAVPSMAHAFTQYFEGATDPLSTGRQLIGGAHAFAVQQAFLPLVGMLAAKMAVLNLLPLPAMNGGQVLLTLMTKDLRETPAWQHKLAIAGVCVTLALAAAWLGALLAFAAGH